MGNDGDFLAGIDEALGKSASQPDTASPAAPTDFLSSIDAALSAPTEFGGALGKKTITDFARRARALKYAPALNPDTLPTDETDLGAVHATLKAHPELQKYLSTEALQQLNEQGQPGFTLNPFTLAKEAVSTPGLTTTNELVSEPLSKQLFDVSASDLASKVKDIVPKPPSALPPTENQTPTGAALQEFASGAAADTPQVLAGIADFLQSPVGAATTAASLAAPPAAPYLLGPFVADMATKLPGQVKTAVEKPTPENVQAPLETAGFMALMSAGAGGAKGLARGRGGEARISSGLDAKIAHDALQIDLPLDAAKVVAKTEATGQITPEEAAKVVSAVKEIPKERAAEPALGAPEQPAPTPQEPLFGNVDELKTPPKPKTDTVAQVQEAVAEQGRQAEAIRQQAEANRAKAEKAMVGVRQENAALAMAEAELGRNAKAEDVIALKDKILSQRRAEAPIPQAAPPEEVPYEPTPPAPKQLGLDLRPTGPSPFVESPEAQAAKIPQMHSALDEALNPPPPGEGITLPAQEARTPQQMAFPAFQENLPFPEPPPPPDPNAQIASLQSAANSMRQFITREEQRPRVGGPDATLVAAMRGRLAEYERAITAASERRAPTSTVDTLAEPMRQAGMTEPQIAAAKVLADRIQANDPTKPANVVLREAASMTNDAALAQKLHQVEELVRSGEKLPKFPKSTAIADVSKWLMDKVKAVFPKDLSKVSTPDLVKGFYEHTVRELKAFREMVPDYKSFYEDAFKGANKKLDEIGMKHFGRLLTPVEKQLFSVVSSMSSALKPPVTEVPFGMDIMKFYVDNGRLPNVRAGEVRVNPEFARGSYDKLQGLIADKGLNGAMEWLGSHHSWEDINHTLKLTKESIANRAKEEHEYLNRKDGGLGVFGVAGPKQASYIVNRWGDLGFITKDLWVSRFIARMRGDLMEGGEPVSQKWLRPSGDMRRVRTALDEAWRRVATEQGIQPANVQEQMWAMEKYLWEKHGATDVPSGGVTTGIDKWAEQKFNQQSAKGVNGTYDPISRTIELVRGKADFSTVVHELGHHFFELLKDHPEYGPTIKQFYGNNSEAFARHLEAEIRSGKAPVGGGLKPVFQAMAQWMKDIYTKWKYGTASPEVKAMFSNALFKESPQSKALLEQFNEIYKSPPKRVIPAHIGKSVTVEGKKIVTAPVEKVPSEVMRLEAERRSLHNQQSRGDVTRKLELQKQIVANAEALRKAKAAEASRIKTPANVMEAVKKPAPRPITVEQKLQTAIDVEQNPAKKAAMQKLLVEAKTKAEAAVAPRPGETVAEPTKYAAENAQRLIAEQRRAHEAVNAPSTEPAPAIPLRARAPTLPSPIKQARAELGFDERAPLSQSQMNAVTKRATEIWKAQKEGKPLPPVATKKAPNIAGFKATPESTAAKVAAFEEAARASRPVADRSGEGGGTKKSAYTAEDLAALKVKHGIPEVKTAEAPSLESQLAKSVETVKAGGKEALKAEQAKMPEPVPVEVSKKVKPAMPHKEFAAKVVEFNNAIQKIYKDAKFNAKRITEAERPLAEMTDAEYQARIFSETDAYGVEGAQLKANRLNAELQRLKHDQSERLQGREPASPFASGKTAAEKASAVANFMRTVRESVHKAAVEARGRGVSLSSGLDPTKLKDMAAISLDLAYEDAHNFGQWAKKIRAQMKGAKKFDDLEMGLLYRASLEHLKERVPEGKTIPWMANAEKTADAMGVPASPAAVATPKAKAKLKAQLELAGMETSEASRRVEKVVSDAYSLWVADVLSGYWTHIRNIGGNASFEAMNQLAVKPVGALLDPLARKIAKLSGAPANLTDIRQTYFNEVGPATRAYLSGFPEGLADGLRIVREGVGPQDIQKFGFQPRELGGGGKNPINWVGRTLAAEDAMFRTAAKNSELATQAVAQAMREGKRGPVLERRINELMKNPTVDMLKAVEEHGKRSVFAGEPGPRMKALEAWVDSDIGNAYAIRPLRYFIPFIRVVSNIMKEGVRLTPAGLLELGKVDVRMDPRRSSDVMARAAIGSLIMLGAGTLYSQGNLTGSPPTDQAARAAWDLAKMRPYSIKIGGRWFNYSNAGPLAIPLATVATWKDAHNKALADENTSTILEAIKGMGAFALNTTFLTGFENLLSLMKDPGAQASRIPASLLGGFIPGSGLLRNLTTDIPTLLNKEGPEVKNPQSVTENIAAGLPFLNSGVQPKLDMLGRVMHRPTFPGSQVKDPVDRELITQNVTLAKPSSTLTIPNEETGKSEEFRLDPKQYFEFQRVMGQAAYDSLSTLFDSEEYNAAQDEDKADLIHKAVSAAHKDAKEQWLIDIGGADTLKEKPKVVPNFMGPASPALR